MRAFFVASIGRVVRVIQELLGAGVLPRVDNPWPESIGLDFPFTMAGAAGVVAALVPSARTAEQRERDIVLFGRGAFAISAVFYAVSLAVQLV